MSKLKFVKELLSTNIGTEGSLLIPSKIADTLVDEVGKFLIPRSEAAMFFGPGDIPGSSINVNRVTADQMDVRVVPEGAEIPIDQSEYTNLQVTPAKFGVSIRITRELLEDAKFNLLQHSIRIAGKRLAENENSLIITALDTGDNTVGGGATVTIANITTAMQFLEDADYRPTTYVVGMEVLNDLRNIDTFVEANKIGNTEMLQKGFLGTVFGMNVIRASTNAGMTTTTSYVFDKDFAYVIAEKRPMTVENFDLPSQDMSGAAITQRIAVSALRTAAIAVITSS